MKSARFFAIAAVLVTALVASACTGKDAVDQSAGGQFRFVSGTKSGKLIAVGDRKKSGSFSGDGLSGGTVALSEFAGKVVVVNFWATWCGPCQVETPQFDAMYRKNKAKDVQFVGIDTKETSRDAARSFVKDNAISYPMIWDEPGRTAVQIGKLPALALPFTVLIDKQQRVAAVYLTKLSPKDLQPVLDKLVAEG
ncbi:MAG TPA: TlpA disulfide reductase family protein [Jatrophihabitantaceae bacterium]|nr:TlpA disulfide reductase family protein [Jatrophihabitantaceae bacterium]